MGYDILVKPKFDNGGGGFLFKTPGSFKVFDAQGNVIDSGSTSKINEGYYKVKSGGIASGRAASFEFEGETYTLTQPGMRHEFGFGNSKPTKVSSKGALDGTPSGGFSAEQQANFGTGSVGTAGQVAFPQGDFSGLNPMYIPNLQIPKVDPIKRTGEVGDFNREQFDTNFNIGMGNASKLLDLEFATNQDFNRRSRGLQAEGILQENRFNENEIGKANLFDQGQTQSAIDFNRSQLPATNELNRGEISQANKFNQNERLGQLETALPGVRQKLLNQIERGSILSEGRFTTDLEDRAFEVAGRSAAADSSVVRGFGDDSVFGKRTSDLLSAQQRLNLSKSGEDTLDRFTTLGGNLVFDQPIKQNPVLDQPQQFQPQRSQPQQARTSQDVRGLPARPASELATQQQTQLNPLTTIEPATAIGYDINQHQFQGNLDQRTNEYNSTRGYNAQLEQIYGGIFNAQQEAGAINANTGINIAQSNFDDQLSSGQTNATIGAVGNIVGGVVGGVLSSRAGSGGLGGVLQSILTGGGGTGLSGTAGEGGVFGSAYDILTGATDAVSGGGATGGGGAASGTGTAGASGLANAALIAGVALASGKGIQETIKGLQDGSISKEDVKRLVGDVGTGGFLAQGVNDIVGKPISSRDANNAILLSNPATAALALGDMFNIGGSGKSEAQQKRDAMRDQGENLGVFVKPDDDTAEARGLNPSHHYAQLADGSYYDVGKDGGAKIKNYGENIDGKDERNTFDIDWSDPRAPESVAQLNPLAYMMFGENYQNMMGHLWNAGTSNNRSLSETKQNFQYMANNAGIDYQTGLKVLKQQKDKLGSDTYLAMVDGWNKLMLSKGVSQDIVI